MGRPRGSTFVWAALPAGALLAPRFDATHASSLFVGAAIAAAALLVATMFARGRARKVITLAFLCALSAGLGGTLERRERAAWEREASSWLPENGYAREGHFIGQLLEDPAERWDGETVLLVRGRPEPAGSARRPFDLELHVAPPSGSGATLELAAGDEIRVWCRVRRPRGAGEPGRDDPEKYLRARGIDGVGSIKNAAVIERVSIAEGGVRSRVGRVKNAARERLGEALADRRNRALAAALLLGDRKDLEPSDVRVLRDAGLAHLVAISGLHVAILIALAHGGLVRARLPRPLCWVLTALVMVAFVLLVGPSPSVLRAVLGAALVLFGLLLGREGHGWHALVVVASLLVLFRPSVVHSAGFQLTFAATAGLVTACARAHPLGVRGALRISIAAYVATAPILAWHFGRLAPVGIAVNLVAVPVSTAVLLAAIAAVALARVPGVGELLAMVCEVGARAIWWIADRAAGWEPGAFAVVAPPLWLVLVTYVALACSRLPSRAPVNRFRMAAGATAAISLVLFHIGTPPERPSTLEAAVLDIGQGLAVSLRGAQGSTALIDAGGSREEELDPGERIVVPHLLHAGRRLDVLALTHDHLDHIGGAFAVVRSLDVGELWIGPEGERGPRLRALVDLARSRGVAIVLAEPGLARRAADLPLTILAPSREDGPASENDRSLVVLAGRAPARLLVLGDLSGRGEIALVRANGTLRAEAIVVSHHGSASSTTPQLVSSTEPAWALISAGFGNRFGHPHPSVVQRLESAGAHVLRTDLDGRIVLGATPTGWQARTWR